mmetsp:Transcript_6734/g.5027  ORF Transcript_6734/g.5027 Transcript_6734/m.5027 type:complete len:96 (-) Transcript_6734:555-842(-)
MLRTALDALTSFLSFLEKDENETEKYRKQLQKEYLGQNQENIKLGNFYQDLFVIGTIHYNCEVKEQCLRIAERYMSILQQHFKDPFYQTELETSE